MTNVVPSPKLEKEPHALWRRYVEWLYQHKELGLYLDVRLMKDRDKGEHEGYAFVAFNRNRVVNDIHGFSTKKNKEYQEKLPLVVLRAVEIIYSKANSEILHVVKVPLSPFIEFLKLTTCTLLRERDSGHNPSIGVESLYPCSADLSLPSMLHSVPPIAAPMVYDHRAESGASLGMLSSSSLYGGYGSFSIEVYNVLRGKHSRSSPRFPVSLKFRSSVTFAVCLHLHRTPVTSAEGRRTLSRVRRLVLSRHRASHGVSLFRVVVPYNLSSSSDSSNKGPFECDDEVADTLSQLWHLRYPLNVKVSLVAVMVLQSSAILQNVFLHDAFVTALRKAEQFLWAGSKMDSVRDMVKNLIEAQKWAEGIREKLSYGCVIGTLMSRKVHLYSLVQLAHVLNYLNSCALAVVLNGLTDFSPSLSPSGLWTAVASYGTPNGWAEEVEDFPTHIYVFLTHDRTHRVKVAELSGWPSWVDDRTLYFHRRGQDQWWSVYRAILPSNAPVSLDSVIIQRVTPPGLQAFTPRHLPRQQQLQRRCLRKHRL
ncbi:hypothetical protein D0Y65_048820 [Glycine soja]|uniref:Uncharacterized protein n=1 Tax=Glycine soja TaxID=3848 RepID=A0A445FUJ1_GLYSO|nr:hypothetical protein D0Y65_048820 [Glycine soja]